MPQLASPSGLAVLRMRPAQTQTANLLVCMAPGALRTALVAHYASGVLVGCEANLLSIFQVVRAPRARLYCIRPMLCL